MPTAFRHQEYRGVEKIMPFYLLEDRYIGTIIKINYYYYYYYQYLGKQYFTRCIIQKYYSGNTLKISSIRKEDRGTYYCIAENGVGRGARRNINVEVEFAPVITAPRPRLGQALQYDMDLECHVEAYPPPAIIWLKDDVQLSNNQHYSISHFATADEYTDTTIRVITIEKRQYGEYVCRAANKLGTAETKVELFGKRILKKRKEKGNNNHVYCCVLYVSYKQCLQLEQLTILNAYFFSIR